MTTWIMVCDVSRAMLFSAQNRDEDWELLKEFQHAEGRMLSKEIRPSGPPGRMLKSKGQGARSSMEPHTWPKDAEAERFAETLAKYLKEAAGKHEFDALVLVAPPHFLGTLHTALPKQAAKHLQATVDKDLAQFDAAEIRERLIDVVFPAKSSAHEP